MIGSSSLYQAERGGGRLLARERRERPNLSGFTFSKTPFCACEVFYGNRLGVFTHVKEGYDDGLYFRPMSYLPDKSFNYNSNYTSNYTSNSTTNWHRLSTKHKKSPPFIISLITGIYISKNSPTFERFNNSFHFVLIINCTEFCLPLSHTPIKSSPQYIYNGNEKNASFFSQPGP